jgi:GDPmannose 4,6-dehydratase
MKKALITGITGQDGSYLTEQLLGEDYSLLGEEYEVHGLLRRTSHFNRQNIDHIHDKRLHLYYCDLEDTSSLCHLMKKVQPDEVYHLAGMSHVKISNDIPEYTFDTNAIGTTRLLEAVRIADINPCIYNAATSELFGGSDSMLNEESPFHPRSPYAISKLHSYWTMRYYRDAYGLKTWNGIMFNHESPRRSENFITRKITLSIAKILDGKQDYLEVGNIEARRDWGYAPDYTRAMTMMLHSGTPDDYVIATGETHSVKEFIVKACEYSGVDYQKILKINPSYIRDVDVNCLIGDSTKARERLGWKPMVLFNELVRLMVNNDLEKVSLCI